MNLLCLKIWSDKNVLRLFSYTMMWSDFRIDELRKTNWKEKGKAERKKKKKERRWGGGLLLSWVLHIQNKRELLDVIFLSEYIWKRSYRFYVYSIFHYQSKFGWWLMQCVGWLSIETKNVRYVTFRVRLNWQLLMHRKINLTISTHHLANSSPHKPKS